MIRLINYDVRAQHAIYANGSDCNVHDAHVPDARGTHDHELHDQVSEYDHENHENVHESVSSLDVPREDRCVRYP